MTDTQTNNSTVAPVEPEVLKEMMDAGVFYGRKKSRTHPRMKQYVLHNRNGIEIINLHKTGEIFDEAAEFLRKKVKEGGLILMIGTQPAFEDIVAETATELGLPVVLRRWLGGTLTNYGVISKRVEYYKKLRQDSTTHALEKYTKKERVGIEREMNRLKELLGGLELMTRIPDAIVMVDPVLHNSAMREARQLKVPVVALSNVDTNPDTVDYPVPGNTKSRQSITWFMNRIAAVIKEAKNSAAAHAAHVAANAAPVAAPKAENEEVA